jgi:hypothetical protein
MVIGRGGSCPERVRRCTVKPVNGRRRHSGQFALSAPDHSGSLSRVGESDQEVYVIDDSVIRQMYDE